MADPLGRYVKDVGHRIRLLRVARRLTQGDLAGRMRCSQAAVSRWESGSNVPDVEVLYLVAEALDVKPAELLPDPRE